MPTLFKRSNGIYYAILTDDHGHRKWINTRERKQSLAIKKIDALSSEEIVETQTTTLEDFRRDFIAYSTSVLSKGTVDIYQRSFAQFIKICRDIPIAKVTHRHVDVLKERRMGEIRRVTLNIELRSLKSAFLTAVRWKVINENPFKGVKLCQVDDEPPLYFQLKNSMLCFQ